MYHYDAPYQLIHANLRRFGERPLIDIHLEVGANHARSAGV
ncbi:hypothetical protein [Pseudomonas abieticivorans]|nr:hypothetical protein [Pseudomonas sp. PIA16]